MASINVIVIPADKNAPVREDTYDSTDYKNLTALIFNGDRDGTFDRMTAGDEGTTFWFDDDGLARLDTEEVGDIINLRAMQLYAYLAGMGTTTAALHDYAVPLVGDYVITGGADEEGNTLDYPGWLKEFPYTWHEQITMRKAGE